MEEDLYSIGEYRPDVGHGFCLSHHRDPQASFSTNLVDRNDVPLSIVCDGIGVSGWFETAWGLELDFRPDRKALAFQIGNNVIHALLMRRSALLSERIRDVARGTTGVVDEDRRRPGEHIVGVESSIDIGRWSTPVTWGNVAQ
jgi:hypothetical protein